MCVQMIFMRRGGDLAACAQIDSGKGVRLDVVHLVTAEWGKE